MAINRWLPTEELLGLHNAMDRLFSDVFGETAPTGRPAGDGGRTGMLTRHLPLDIMETETGYRIEAPVPGFKPEEVEVTYSDGMLTISAQHQEERRRREGNYVRREIGFGNYWRQISLPGEVREDKIKASFNDGMLVVEVPRMPKPRPTRVQVQHGQGAKQLEGKRMSPPSSRKS
jgi:HSP20 family protein